MCGGPGAVFKLNKNGVFVLCVLIFAFAGSRLGTSRNPSPNPTSDVPVVVELFTSEGCSSCPPADALLQKLDAQPYSGVRLIVLSEHVDYWNHIGWTDPYSSHTFSRRQDAYGSRFHLDSVYTPQMVVDGAEEFVGNSANDARKAFERAAGSPKVSVRISDVTRAGDLLRAHLETGPLPSGARGSDVLIAIALDHAESQVATGENAGRRLAHVAVVRSLSKAGTIASGRAFAHDVSVKLDNQVDPASFRLIVFIQEPGPGRVLGAAMERVAAR